MNKRRHAAAFCIIILLLMMICLFSGCANEAEASWRPGVPLEKSKVKIGVIHVDDASSGYSLAHDMGVREMQEAVAKARQRILSGEVNVFGGVMETNDGRKIGTEGGTLSDSEIIGGINWYYRNVVELK